MEMRKKLVSSLFVLCFVWVAKGQSASLPDFASLVQKYGPAVVNISKD